MDEFCADHSAHKRAIAVHDERMNQHGRELDDLRECVVRLTALQEEASRWREEADARLSALEAKPAKRWETASNYVLTAVIGLVLGVVAAHLGM